MEITDKSLLGMILQAPDDDAPEAKECPMPTSTLPQELPYAMAYVQFQKWQKPYDSEAALCRGTIFPCLDKPFIGEEAVGNGK